MHQITHNMTTDCSLNYKFNTWKFQAQTLGEHVVYRNCFWHSEQFLYTICSPHVLKKRRAFDKDLPVPHLFTIFCTFDVKHHYFSILGGTPSYCFCQWVPPFHLSREKCEICASSAWFTVFVKVFLYCLSKDSWSSLIRTQW